MRSIVLFLLAVSCALVSMKALSSEVEKYTITMYPQKIVPCKKGESKVYAECANQSNILKKAKKEASKSNKSVLVVYGAEWCIWCHVFDKYIKGYHSNFDYRWTYKGEKKRWSMSEKENKERARLAMELNKYVSENFIVAHIEGDFSNGKEALAKVGVDKNKLRYMPYIIVLDSAGKYASHMPAGSAVEGLEKREDSGVEYRGYNREILLRELKKLREQAQK